MSTFPIDREHINRYREFAVEMMYDLKKNKKKYPVESDQINSLNNSYRYINKWRGLNTDLFYKEFRNIRSIYLSTVMR